MNTKTLFVQLFILLVFIFQASAQNVGINTSGSLPDSSAILDIEAADKGMLVPRVSLSDVTNMNSPINNPATSLLVWNTNVSVIGGFGVGYYFFDGIVWQSLQTSKIVKDSDGDTHIQVEKSTDEDVIRFSTGGMEYFNMENGVLHTLNTGSSVFIGLNAGLNDDRISNYNVFIGEEAGSANQEGGKNVVLGVQAGKGDSLHNKYENVMVGYQAGLHNEGDRNVFLGYQAGFNEETSEKLYIDNSSTISPLIYGDFADDTLRVNGVFDINDAFSFPLVDGTSNQVLTTNGNGNVNWEDKTINTDAQVLDLIGDSLFISGGNAVALERSEIPALGFTKEGCSLGLGLDYFNGGAFIVVDTIWQAFQAGQTGYLREFELHVRSISDSLNGKLRVFEGEGIGGNMIYERTVINGWRTYTFDAEEVPITEDSVYTFYLEDTVTSNHFNIWVSQTDPTYPYSCYISIIGWDRYKFRTKVDSCSQVPFLYANTNSFLNLELVDSITFSDGSVFTSANVNTDEQLISLNGDSLSISNGNTVDISSVNSTQSVIEDTDGNTKIEVEKNTNEDIIRFTQNSAEYMNLNAGRINIINTGSSVFLGSEAGLNDDLSNNKNAYIGEQAGKDNTSGSHNTGIGYRALAIGIAASGNTGVGSEALAGNTGALNSAFGFECMEANTTGSENVAMGYLALNINMTGDNNVGIGSRAGMFKSGGGNNVLLGASAGEGTSPHTKSNNVMIGYQAGQLNEGSNNVMLGYQAGQNETGSDKLYIDNSNTSNPLIYGEFNNDLVEVNGQLSVTSTLDVGSSLTSGSLDVSGDIEFGSNNDNPIAYDRQVVMVSGKLNSNGSPANVVTSSSYIASTTRNSTGTYTVTFVSGTFVDEPIVTVNSFTGSGTNRVAIIESVSTTSFKVQIRNFSGTLSDAPFNFIAIGER